MFNGSILSPSTIPLNFNWFVFFWNAMAFIPQFLPYCDVKINMNIKIFLYIYQMNKSYGDCYYHGIEKEHNEVDIWVVYMFWHVDEKEAHTRIIVKNINSYYNKEKNCIIKQK